jgi:hypothetical protein
MSGDETPAPSEPAPPTANAPLTEATTTAAPLPTPAVTTADPTPHFDLESILGEVNDALDALRTYVEAHKSLLAGLEGRLRVLESRSTHSTGSVVFGPPSA